MLTVNQLLMWALIAVVSFVLLLALAALYHKIKKNIIGKLEYTRTFSKEEAIEGEEITVTESIYNPTVLPMFFVDVSSHIHGNLKIAGHENEEGMQEVISRFHIPPFTKLTRRHRIECTRRGHYIMSSAAVLERTEKSIYTKEFRFHSELFVFPKEVKHPPLNPALNYMQGDGRSSARIILDPFSVVGVRDYAFGDPFSMINFKATAKSAYQGVRGIKTNELDSTSDRMIMVLVNFQAPPDYTDAESYGEKMEYALSLAASILGEAARAGCRLGFSANCPSSDGKVRIDFPMTSGLIHTNEILREISMIEMRCASSFYSLLENCLKDGISMSEIIIITPFVDKDLEKGAFYLKQRNAVTVIEI